MVVQDIWGTIKIEREYEALVKSKEFADLKTKTQLGLSCNPNAVHTRYQHSIGVYYLACKLVDICKIKFSKILNITVKDEQAIKCMALVHDIGHGCFSHVSEKFLPGSHETNTINILTNPNSEIHQAIVNSFGKEVLKKTIDLIQLKETIKGSNEELTDNSLVLIISKLLSGGIDIDRIDYIYRDSKHVTGEINDYSSILDSITLESIDDSLEVVFDGWAEFAIANFFNKRFELYDTIYLKYDGCILESIFGKLLDIAKIKITWETSEIEMNNIIRECLNSDNPVIRRYASLILTKRLTDDFLIKEVNDLNSLTYLKNKLLTDVPELSNYSACIFSTSSKISIYNKDNKIFINKSGLILDISESSKILNSELKKEKHVLALDLELLKTLLRLDNINEKAINEIIKRIQKSVSLEIEQEKKYVIKSESKKEQTNFKCIRDAFGLVNPEYIKNFDTYYDENNILETYRIAVRRRISSGHEEWTIKKPLNDKTSIVKREEKNFTSLNQVMDFLQNEWKIPVKSLSEVISLKTSRVKYDLEYNEGLFEVVFDKTVPSLNGVEYPSNYMLEIELKKGNSSGLYFIDQKLKKFSFIEECKYSKKEIALSFVNLENQVKPFQEEKFNPEDYQELVSSFFISSPELLNRLRDLDAKKQEIRTIREVEGKLPKPIVLTISGTPRAGKTTTIDNLFEFLKKADLKTAYLPEPAGMIYQTLKSKEEKQKLLADRVGFVLKQYEIGEEYINNNLGSNDIILCDRGILDTFVWMDMYYQLRMIDQSTYHNYLTRLKAINGYLSQFYILYCNSAEAMKRDYLNSLSIEPRTTMNQSNVERYNASLLRVLPIIEAGIDKSKLIDTSNLTTIEPSIMIASDLLEQVKTLYLRR